MSKRGAWNERLIYLPVALGVLCSLVVCYPFFEVCFGVVTLLATLAYTLVAAHVGLPQVTHCGDYCGR